MQSFRQSFEEQLNNSDRKDMTRLYNIVSRAAIAEVADRWPEKPGGGGGKRACYLSAEFLIGRMVYSNLYNLGLMDEFKQIMQNARLDPNIFEGVDDAALGNGGLGRLAACFLDSGATMGYRLDGYGIRYKYGLFYQYFDNGFQNEEADDWLRFGDPWSIRRDDERVRVDFKGQSVWAVPFDMPVIGYGGKTVNTLRLWQAEPVQAFDFAAFNDMKYHKAYNAAIEAEAISSVLYPNDETRKGKILRLKQQYFFASASLRSIMRQYKREHDDFTDFAKHYAVQLNDTHPTVAIPEMLRILMAEEGMTLDDAFIIVRDTFAYTNHTIMAEALEKWDVDLFCDVVPEVYPYVIMLQNKLMQDLHNKGINGADQIPYYLVDNKKIHMARMAIYATHSTNGVAALHTDILKNDALKEWYAIYPERFNNKTNGITQRRWLGLCNPELAQFITERIGDGWLTDLDRLKELEKYMNDNSSLKRLAEIKRMKKQQLAGHVNMHEGGVKLDMGSMFDVQVKRLHEYKRQLLNAFGVMDIYFALKEGRLKDFAPTTVLFGAKAAPGYYRAKGIIKYINEIARRLNNDPDTKDLLKVLFVHNYNVSYAEKLIPAADVSEQISTAGTEASGTSNMKFMLNGAVTLGTYDGANVEIVQQAGEHNNYIFGARVEQLATARETYNPRTLYEENPRIHRVLDTLIDGSFYDSNTGMFRDLYDSILDGASWHKPDQYFLLLDFESYVDARLKANRCFRDEIAFQKQCLANIANAGKFSSDRTIREYGRDIWGL